MKHKSWVFFYVFAIILLIILAFFLTGVLNIKIPSLKIGKSSPETTAEKTRVYCNFERYDSLVSQSLKSENKGYLRITKNDPVYTQSAKNLCSVIKGSRKVEKKQVSSTEWEYKYYTGVLSDSSQTYKILFFDDDWRFVLK